MRTLLALVLALALPTAVAGQIQKAAPPRKDIPRIVPPTVVSTGFDDAAGAAGWFPLGRKAGSWAAAGGNPGGVYSLTGITGFGNVCGAFTNRPEFVGSFTRKSTIEADLRLSSNMPAELKPRLLLQKSTNLGQWELPIALAVDSVWHHVSVTVDPGWTDAQAKAAGWQPSSDNPAAPWSDVMQSVYRVGFIVRASVQSTPRCQFALDNFKETR